jgi:predicted chitinase
MIPTRPKWDPAAFNSYSLVLNNFINYAQQLKVEATSSATTSTGFIPINVSLNMTGMSGMKIYQEFNLKTDFLPSNYQTQMSWLIKGVNHTIENNMWSTTIESLSLPNTTTKPDSFEKLANITLSKLADATKIYLIPISYKSIVEKIIARAKELIDGIDKDRLTAILTVAQAESNLNASKTESFKYDVSTPEGIATVKTIFSKLKNKTDEEIKNIFSNSQTAATFLYGANGYLYRGRGLAQVTGFDNYEAADNLLESLYNYTNPYYGNLVKKPEEALIEFKAIDILILSKREGTFGKSLSINMNYTTNPIAILDTQNQEGYKVSAIVNRYTEALNSINQTKWIQELLNKK